MTELLCIHCSSPLNALELEGQSVVACPTGHGVWLSRSQLDSLTEDNTDDASDEAEQTAWSASADAPDEMSSGRFRPCPVCSKTLRKDNWKYGSGVVVDVCDAHGIWVDKNEIDHIEAWTEAWHAHAG
jgi:Zn-finger nucleic acid-binding protein